MPERLNNKESRIFLREIQPILNTDRPQIVFDCSLIRLMDAAGVDRAFLYRLLWRNGLR